MAKPQLHIFGSETLADGFAALFLREVQNCISERGSCSVALPGGSVAEQLFGALTTLPVEWPRVHFFWGDERAVPQDHPDSNYALARRLLLEPIAAAEENVHRILVGEGSTENAALAYEQTLQECLGAPPILDLVLLGVGSDGHVCSLFPGHPLLQEETRFAAAVADSPKPPRERVSLTLPMLLRARLAIVAAFGESKAALVSAAVQGNTKSPVETVLHRNGRTWLVLDAAAASLLQPTVKE